MMDVGGATAGRRLRFFGGLKLWWFFKGDVECVHNLAQ